MVPGLLNLYGTLINTDGEEEQWQQLLEVPRSVSVRPGVPYMVQFNSSQSGALSEVNLPTLHITSLSQKALLLRARL